MAQIFHVQASALLEEMLYLCIWRYCYNPTISMIHNQPKISVIVAVYNAEKTLKRCVDSLLAQTFVNFEVLLIDDGSTDNSGGICDEYAERDKRLRVFHQENRGVACVRQKGIEEAWGRYSIHVDADDWADPTMLYELYAEAIRSDADMVLCDYHEESTEGSLYKTQESGSASPDTIIKEILSGKLMGVLWNKLIKHELYTKYNIHFLPGINHCEDVLVCTRLLLNNISVAYLPAAYYHYDTRNMSSITRNYTEATYCMRKRYIEVLQSILPVEYNSSIEENILQVKVGAFVNGCMTAKEYREYHPMPLSRILASDHSPRIKVAFALANLGMFGVGKWFYKTYSRVRKKGTRYLLLWGDHELNAGPSNVHRSLITHSQGELRYVRNHHKLARYIELIWKCIMADVVILPSFSTTRDVKLIRALCRKVVCISHGCLKIETVINSRADTKERVEKDERTAFAAARVIVCVSEKHMLILSEQYPEFAKKMTFVNNGVDISPRRYVEKNMRTIAVSGGNRNIKNNVYVCKAVQLLNDAGYHCKVKIFGRNYPECEDLSKYPCAEYMGQLNKEEYYERLDEIALFVVASELESFGLVVADALNCHCSILMSHNIGAASIMQTREEDFVNNPRNINELADRIQHLLEYPNAERLLNSVNVQECSEEESWKKMKAICYSV